MTWMKEQILTARPVELQPLLELTERVGTDPLLTQASTGNSSIKVDGSLWMKASGKWMADALRDDIFTPLKLAEIRDCLSHGADPAERYPGVSLETAMHAALPHRVVLHVHSINTIAWAVRGDAPSQLERRLEGLPWRWVPYRAPGLPLSLELERTLSGCPEACVFVLGNHGLVIGGEDAVAVGRLLAETERRLALCPRPAHPADYTVLMEMAGDSSWDLPEDDETHALGTDPISRKILQGGLLYPCQAIFSDSTTSELFRAIPGPTCGGDWRDRYRDRPFLIVEGRGLIVNRALTPSEIAMLSGLAQVVQRVPASAPVRYLAASEVAEISSRVTDRYRELANAAHR
jgi:rhamnose utilization protein RhaD (predicted bifunctional aldolase and dehydrogenase)